MPDPNETAHRIMEQATADSAPERQFPKRYEAELWQIVLGPGTGDVVAYKGGHTFRVGETIDREDGPWRVLRIEVDPGVMPRLIVERE